MRYDVIKKIGEGNRGEVYKVKLENGQYAALKWAKNYDIDKEWQILKMLKGFYSPKPLFRGKNYFVMELIEGKPLKDFINSPIYYDVLKKSLIAAYKLDEKRVFHKQLGRYYHIIYHHSKITFLDFERATLSEKSRNFLQIIGYYLFRDENIDKKNLELILNLYKKDKLSALKKSLKVIDDCKNKAFCK